MNNASMPSVTGALPGPPAFSAHPPRAPLVLRVGVVGHRPDPAKRPSPDVTALRDISRKLLLQIQNTFAGILLEYPGLFAELSPPPDGQPPGLRLISGLAEGADQWLADEAIKLGYELQAVLPFARGEYENDFTVAQGLAEHRRLRGLAAAVFELDGCRARSGESYLAAGRVLLNQTDLLIALWDGKPSHGTGGTGQIVQEALQRSIPTLWVRWQTPSQCQLLSSSWRLLQHPGDIKDDLKPLENKVRELLLPPAAEPWSEQPDESDLREAYFAERRRSWTLLGGWWNFFRDLLRGRPKGLTIRIADFISVTQKDWQREWEAGHGGQKHKYPFPAAVINWVDDHYLSHYAWANQLSVYYANHYRSSFVWIYLLGALAVLLALIGKTAQASHTVELIFIVAEVIVIGVIIGLTWYGRRRRWHERWIDYRTLAERLRLVRFNCLLGGVWQQASVPSHLATYGNPATAWMHWHARAVERAAGLPHVVVDTAYLSACRELLLEALIAGQADYHKQNIARLHTVERRLHRSGEWLFLATLMVCLFHLAVALHEPWFGAAAPALDRWLIFGAAFLPALGAAMAAIRSQGEFRRVVQRSRAMQEELAQLRQAVASVPMKADELNSQVLQLAVEQTTRLMYNEVLDWRIVFQDRPLVWPA